MTDSSPASTNSCVAESDVHSPFDCLPPEMISHIFHFLPYQDLKSARLVCKEWYMASLDPKMTDRDKCVLRVCREASPVSYGIPLCRFQRLRDSKRQFHHFEIVGNTSAWCDLRFFKLYGKNLRSLSLWPSLKSEKDLFSSLNYCPNLRELNMRIEKISLSFEEVTDYPSDHYPVLPSLETVQIVGLGQANFGLFHLILIKAPHLKTATLSVPLMGDLAALDFIEYLKRFYDRSFVLHFNLVGDRTITITVVKKSDDEIDHCVRVAELLTNTLPKCIDWRCLESLTRLYLARSIKVTDELMTAICSCCVNLRSISCANVSGLESIRMLSLLNKLESLALHTCYVQNHEDLLSGLCAEVNNTLQQVLLVEFTGARRQFFLDFARTHPALISMSLVQCYYLDDAAVRAICTYQTSLRSLRICDCPFVRDAGFDSLDKPTHFYRLAQPKSEVLTTHSIGNLTELHELYLESLSVNLWIFQRGLKFPQLKHIGLSRTLVSEDTLMCFIDNHPQILSMSVDTLPITDDFLHLVVQKLPKLESINIYGCSHVTHEGHAVLKSRGISYLPRRRRHLY